MKAEIHPKVNAVVFIDSSTKAEFATLSTLTSEETKKINGVEHFVIHVDVSSASHPFYTGEKMLVDTAGRVDKFRARMAAGEKKKVESKATTERKEALRRESAEDTITRKAKENEVKKEVVKAEEEKAKAKAKKAPAAKMTAAKKTVAKVAAKKAPAKKK